MKAVAVKKSERRGNASERIEMGTLRCDVCGEDFVIYHHPTSVNNWAADRQAHWLEKVLAEEHERDKKHSYQIELPD